jgi:hypothetical protein
MIQSNLLGVNAESFFGVVVIPPEFELSVMLTKITSLPNARNSKTVRVFYPWSFSRED